MHELSIVLSIIDIAAEQVRAHGAAAVEEIVLDIGELAGVDPGALDFAWESAVRGTVLEGARRIVNRLPGKARCMDCAGEFDANAVFEPCPFCGQRLTTLIQGRELRVKQLTLHEAVSA